MTSRRLVAHRAALRAVRPVLRPRAPGGAEPVTFVLLDAYGESGAVRAVLGLAGELASRHDVRVLSVLRRRDEPFYAFPPGVAVAVADDQRARRIRRPRGLLVHPIDKRPRGTSLLTDARLVRRLRAVRTGVVVGTRPSLNLIVAQLARPGVATIAQEHMNFDRRGPFVRPDIVRHYPALDAVVVLSEHDRRNYVTALGGATRVERIPNAVPRLGGPAADLSRPVVLAIGRLTRQKGFDRLICAFARVARTEPDWTLRICGRGPEHERLAGMVAERGLQDRVALPGAVADIGAEFARASIFVLSSRFEGFPMVILEAMSKGLPVVSFDCATGPADMVEDGRTGFLVPEGDVGGLARALRALARDEPLRRRLGAAGAERVEAFSPARVGARWDALLAEVVRR